MLNLLTLLANGIWDLTRSLKGLVFRAKVMDCFKLAFQQCDVPCRGAVQYCHRNLTSCGKVDLLHSFYTSAESL
jgi:hypothetical protein